MIKHVLSLLFLVLSLHAFSQHGGNQGNVNDGIGNGPGKEAPPTDAYVLSGRRAIKKAIPQTRCNESGRVVMDIVVDKKGRVTEAKLGRGSTTQSPCLVEAAKKAAFTTKWNKDKNATEQQNGKITYIFTIE